MSDKFEDIEIYPVEKSASGDNAYYLNNCEVVGHRPAYCACVRKIEDRKQGRLPSIYSECSAAIGKKNCPAQKLRNEELAEGRALYFVNRRKLQSFQQYQQEMEQQKWASMVANGTGKIDMSKVRAKSAPISKPASKPAPQKSYLDINAGSYADAINAAMAKQESTEPAIQKPVQQEPVNVGALRPGMSLIELARLKLQAQAA